MFWKSVVMFDIVTSDSTLSHVPGPEQAIGEAFRVLRAGRCWPFSGTTSATAGGRDRLVIGRRY